jgi:ribosomal protein S18 acetylase RimI-like enzyme
MYCGGVPAGFIELDSRPTDNSHDKEVEIAYFGLMPEFIGRGLGRYLLAWGIGKAFESDLGRLWVHTCNFDHPEALALYQRAGFEAYRQERTIIDDPRSEKAL